MLTLPCIFLALAAIPLCRAITESRRAGYLGVSGFLVFCLEKHARETYALAGGVRKFFEGREAARRQWDAEVGR